MMIGDTARRAPLIRVADVLGDLRVPDVDGVELGLQEILAGPGDVLSLMGFGR